VYDELCVCLSVGRQSVCYSDLQSVDIRQCARDLAVPRTAVKLVNLLLEGNARSLST